MLTLILLKIASKNINLGKLFKICLMPPNKVQIIINKTCIGEIKEILKIGGLCNINVLEN